MSSSHTYGIASVSISFNRTLAEKQRHAIVAGVGLAMLAGVSWILWPDPPAEGHLTSAVVDVPIVMHTNGGRLEVALVTATEAFRFTAPPKSLLGLDRGETVSNIQAKVVYRYHIEMDKEWVVKFQGSTAIIEAGKVKPSLPVAFDTGTMQKQTVSGWARFDKQENLAELERRMSPELERRASGYLALALPSARTSVADFARNWLGKSKHWDNLKITNVKVVFPGDPPVGTTTMRPLDID